MSELAEKARTLASDYYLKGCNCAESVFLALYEITKPNISAECVKMMTGFGGGVGLSGEICGSIVGAVASLGAIYGFKDPLQVKKEERLGEKGVYRIFNQFMSRFKQKFKSIKCSELIKPFIEKQEFFAKERKLYCSKIAGEAAKIAAKIALEVKERGVIYKFDKNIAGLM